MRVVKEKQAGHLQPDGQQVLRHEGQLQPDLFGVVGEKETELVLVLDAMPRVNVGMDV